MYPRPEVRAHLSVNDHFTDVVNDIGIECLYFSRDGGILSSLISGMLGTVSKGGVFPSGIPLLVLPPGTLLVKPSPGYVGEVAPVPVLCGPANDVPVAELPRFPPNPNDRVPRLRFLSVSVVSYQSHVSVGSVLFGV